MNKALTINPDDNIAVALIDLKAGNKVTTSEQSIDLVTDVQAKHKFALKDFAIGDAIQMYGIKVGIASKTIAKGEVITTQNVHHDTSAFNLDKKMSLEWEAPEISKWKSKQFLGYHRSDGQVGTANYWLVFPLVFCENRNVEAIKTAFRKGLGMEKKDPYAHWVTKLTNIYESSPQGVEKAEFEPEAKENHQSKFETLFPNVDGIRFLTHQAGCGEIRQDSATLCRLLAGYVNNPNVAGATILSLGCQNAQIELMQQSLNEVNPALDKPVIFLEQQQEGTEQQMIANAIKKTFKGLIEANKIKRHPASPDKLTIGLECGGSDGFSGISANPTVGHVADIVSALGGKAILSEFPELCGVEQELINRSVNLDIASKFARLMRSYEKSAEDAGSGFDMNPSPGNIKDGLITDAMKSAGAAKKGGNSPVNDVLDYTEYAKQSGLNLLCTPGNDVESTTGLAGSGANIILFTTGLGTPTGNPITPVIKISSNTKLFEKMPDIIDVDTGPVIEGKKTIEEMGDILLDFILEVASGNTKTKADQLEQYDFIPWRRGVSL